MLFPKRLVYTLLGLWYLFCILSKIDKPEVQIDSKEGYLTLWCHQPHPGQSLNPQTVAEVQGVESGFKLDYQDVFSFKTEFIDSFLRLFFKDISCAFA